MVNFKLGNVMRRDDFHHVMHSVLKEYHTGSLATVMA